jgi:hypothetical protein
MKEEATLATPSVHGDQEEEKPSSGLGMDKDMMGVWLGWLSLCPNSSWSESDKLAAHKLIGEYGRDRVVEYLKDTALCSKTRKYAWRDFWYWAKTMEPTGLTKRNIEAWRRARDAKGERVDEPDPLWGTQSDGDGGKIRIVARKPNTQSERRELLEEMVKPKKNQDYFRNFLVQDSCRKCNGKDTRCECVLMEQVISSFNVEEFGESGANCMAAD